MNCRTCNYPLWNLPDRRCPECGQAFLPSEYDFVSRSVRFLCPLCKQQYFGTDERGHLVPRSFNCVKCHNPISMDDMILQPAQNATEQETKQDVNPWTDPFAGGLFKRWRVTLGRSFAAPTRLINSTPPESTSRRALGFAMINVMIPWLFSMGILLLFSAVPMVSGRGGGVVALGMLAVMLAAWILCPLIFLLLWAAISHFILAITGPSESFRRTAHSLWYASGPYALCGIPCVGAYFVPVALVWWGVVATLMLTRAHGVRGFRATLAVFTPIVILLGAGVALVIFFVSWATGMAAMAQASIAAAQSSLQNQRTTAVIVALRNYANTNSSYPKHAGELLTTGALGLGDVSLSTDPLVADNIPIANTTLGKFELSTPDVKQQVVSSAAASLPSNVIAHRLGDYVFTYHGIPTTSPDRGLWLFIAEIPDNTPPQSVPPSSGTSAGAPPVTVQGKFSASSSGVVTFDTSTPVPGFIVGLADGRIQTVPKFVFAQSLTDQNTLRATFNLPPLPDPTTVTTSGPAVGSN